MIGVGEYLRFPKRMQPQGGATQPGSYVSTANMETIVMRRQCWAIDGVVFGLPRLYQDRQEGFTVIEGYRCEKCNRVFFAGRLEDFAHECMD